VTYLVNGLYILAFGLFILGLSGLTGPKTAVRGNWIAATGMGIAMIATLISVRDTASINWILIAAGLAIGVALGVPPAKKTKMTAMPQLVALFNGVGGGTVALIAWAEFIETDGFAHITETPSVALVVGSLFAAIIGSVSFWGSLVAFLKLQESIPKNIEKALVKSAKIFQASNVVLLIAAIAVSVYLGLHAGTGTPIWLIVVVLVLAGVMGLFVVFPIGGADMPVVISLYNALTGLAVAFEGFVLDNAAMIIAGTVVGSAGTLLTQLMAKAMNRSLANVLFSDFGSSSGAAATAVSGSMKPIEASDVGVMMAFAQKVIVVPGYGMAVAQAQHKVWEMCQLLIERGVQVKFAIHPVAGRMPGHMNVLLAEAGVPYDLIADLEEINAEFETADVALIIGANDVVNPVARTDKSSPIYGMPILNADKAKNVIVIKRGQGAGFSGIENALFFLDNTRMLYGDGQKAAAELVNAIKAAG
jgi:NAD(P) transhydrogenase subunit beta